MIAAGWARETLGTLLAKALTPMWTRSVLERLCLQWWELVGMMLAHRVTWHVGQLGAEIETPDGQDLPHLSAEHVPANLS